MAAELALPQINERVFRHGRESRTGRQLINMRRSPNWWGVSVAKESKDSP
jgi:hypothetical protein